MTAPTFETITVMVAGPLEGHADGKLWRWEVRRQITGSLPVASGSADTQDAAWDQAREAGVTALHARADR